MKSNPSRTSPCDSRWPSSPASAAESNPRWGAPRIHGELLKLGIEVSQRTVGRLLPRRRKPPSQTWRTILDDHVKELVSIDFFMVPTATFRVRFVLLVLVHNRLRGARFNVTEHPAAEWTALQIVQAFTWDTAPRSPGQIHSLSDLSDLCGASASSTSSSSARCICGGC